MSPHIAQINFVFIACRSIAAEERYLGGILQLCSLLKHMESNLISARRWLKNPGILSAHTGVAEILEKHRSRSGVGELSCSLGNKCIVLQDALGWGARGWMDITELKWGLVVASPRAEILWSFQNSLKNSFQDEAGHLLPAVGEQQTWDPPVQSPGWACSVGEGEYFSLHAPVFRVTSRMDVLVTEGQR